MNRKQIVLLFLTSQLAALVGALLVVGCKSFITYAPPANAPLALMQMNVAEEIICDADRKNNSQPQNERQLEQDSLAQLRHQIARESDPQILYAMAIVLYEGYEDEFRETLRDRLLFSTREAVVNRLSHINTAAAYDYFRRLQEHYGKDGGESLKYKAMNENFPASLRNRDE